VSLSGRVDDLVNGLHGEVEGHELADGVEASESGTDGQTAETRLSDGRVNNTLVTEAVKQTFGDLVAGEGSCQLVYLLFDSSFRTLATAVQSFVWQLKRFLQDAPILLSS